MHPLLHTLDLLRKLFIRGLLTLLPIVITFAIFKFIFQFIHGWLLPLRSIVPTVLKNIPFSELLLITAVIILIGLITQSFLINRILDFFESLLNKIPLLRPVYFGIKQLIMAFTQQEEDSFQKIALIEFPRKGVYSIGFITCTVSNELVPSEKPFYSAYLPTTPNPTTGYYIMVPADECLIINITKQEAMSLIMSGGIVQPDRFSTCEPL